MKKAISTIGFLITVGFVNAQTPDNTNPGTIKPNGNTTTQPVQVPSGTVSTAPPAAPHGINPNPVGTGGTDMTNPNNNGSYEVNPKGSPRDNFQSTPNTTPTYTRQPQGVSRTRKK